VTYAHIYACERMMSMVEFVIGLIAGLISGSYGTWKVSRFLLIRTLRNEDHARAESSYESRKKQFL